MEIQKLATVDSTVDFKSYNFELGSTSIGGTFQTDCVHFSFKWTIHAHNWSLKVVHHEVCRKHLCLFFTSKLISGEDCVSLYFVHLDNLYIIWDE